MKPVSLIIAALLSIGCGSRVEVGNSGGAGAAASSTGAGGDVCSVAGGWRLCAGSGECVDCANDDCFGGTEILDKGGLGVCFNETAHAFFAEPRLCDEVVDGEVCVELVVDNGHMPVPFEVGAAFAAHGGDWQVVYADYGHWTGEALPLETFCPELPGLALCGAPSCAPCPSETVCRGRSPQHPWGMCLPEDAGPCSTTGGICDPDEGCLLYVIEGENQKLADKGGYCLPLDICEATAENLPGGAKCVY